MNEDEIQPKNMLIHRKGEEEMGETISVENNLAISKKMSFTGFIN